MADKKEKKNHKIMPVGNEMVSLIELVEEKFEQQYSGLKPDRVQITNLIAKRVRENNLF